MNSSHCCPVSMCFFYGVVILLISHLQCWQNRALCPESPAGAAFLSQVRPHLCLQKVRQQQHRCVKPIQPFWDQVLVFYYGSPVYASFAFLRRRCLAGEKYELPLLSSVGNILIPSQTWKQALSPYLHVWQFHRNFARNYCSLFNSVGKQRVMLCS